MYLFGIYKFFKRKGINSMEKENVLDLSKYGEGNFAKFKKLYIGSASGISKKGNAYCMARFLEINKFGNGDIVTLSCRDNILPEMCQQLKCGDLVEVIVDVQNMVDSPVLVDIVRKVADSKIL